MMCPGRRHAMHGATPQVSFLGLVLRGTTPGRATNPLRSASRRPFSGQTLDAANSVQLIANTLLVAALASEAVAADPAPAPRAELPTLERSSALPVLAFAPDWRHWLQLTTPIWRSWQIQPRPAPVRRLELRWVYSRLVELPEVDRVGRLAHVDFPMPGVSAGPELLCLEPEPPREDYPRVRELTPGWSWWYVSAEGWAVGVATGTRFVIADHSGTLVDPFTSEARWAFFLP